MFAKDISSLGKKITILYDSIKGLFVDGIRRRKSGGPGSSGKSWSKLQGSNIYHVYDPKVFPLGYSKSKCNFKQLNNMII